ncbi:MAG TPA: hypothetical protein VKZ79_14900 [Alphaproteobacteria bacterium]|nr:hypothetical protein [Alphaproteobacteria bacterium]
MGKGAEEFVACGKAYAAERDAVVGMIDMYRVAEAAGGALFSDWAKVCTTPLLHGGLAMIAERESYHARIFDKRMGELGAEKKATLDNTRSAEIRGYFADPGISDREKLVRFNHEIIGDPEPFFAEIGTLAGRITEDIESREMLRLFHQDELSTTRWLREMETVLTQ